MKNKILCIILSVLLLSSVVCVSADEASAREIAIETVADFFEFSENCRLDSYSQTLKVKLMTDLDLSGQTFSGIPIFCGIFDGNGHAITGIHLDYTGSNTGLFRYVTHTAEILNLKVSGTIQPKGDAAYVGGIAGTNAGTIQNCTFTGTISGTDYIGGIAGYNTESGKIEKCTADGILYGNHFSGGIAGGNSGLIQNCINLCFINTELKQNHVELSDITLDAITGTESAGTITDIGGISGTNTGYISKCENKGNVGYPHIGYNIGGIAGSQTGYIVDCVNAGTIYGRKEVGGIAGQLEPAVAITYTTDTLQILQDQLNTLSFHANVAADHIENAASGVNKQMNLMMLEIQSTIDELKVLIPKDDTEPSIPSAEDFSNIIEILQNTVTSVGKNLKNIQNNLQYAEDNLSNDLNNISNSVANLQQTLNHASEYLGGSVSDHSDADTDEDLTAKIEKCKNSGAIFADLNGGGIAGAIAFENDLDPEADIDIFGDITLNFTGSYRAVITNSENSAPVAVKKQYAGGIVGYSTLGLVRSCNNAADLICPNADFVGGIAGRSNGQIRACYSKSVIAGKKYVGGISGQGKTVSDCIALCQITANENAGMVLGNATDHTLLTNNRYLQTELDIGAIDGISYDTAAQGVSVEDFLLIPELPANFQSYTVTFVFPDQTNQQIILKTGEAINENQIPELPVLDGCKGFWNGLDKIRFFDTTVYSTYEAKEQILQSQQLRSNGLPVLLAEGAFLPDYSLDLSEIKEGLAPNALEGWTFISTDITTLRYLPPENISADDLCVMFKDPDGNWRQVTHTIHGSYLVFDTNGHSNTFCVVLVQRTPWEFYVAAGVALLVIAGIVTILAIKRKKRPKQAIESTSAI